MNTPNLQNSELQTLAARFAAYQKKYEEATGLTLSNSALVRRFPALGSDKTFKLILEGRYEGNLARQLSNYRRAAVQLDGAGREEEETIWPDMTRTENVLVNVSDARLSQGVNRLVKVLGRSGFGKSSCIRLIEEQYPREVITIEADVTTSLPVLLERLLLALNKGRRRGEDEGQKEERRVPKKMSERLAATIEALNEAGRTILAIDESHHLRADSLNGLKTCINQCPELVVVLVGVPSLMRAMESCAPEEAEQLNNNRLYGCITLEVTPADVEKFLTRSLKIGAELAREKAEAFAGAANRRLGFRYLRKLVYWTRQANDGAGISRKLLEEVAAKI